MHHARFIHAGLACEPDFSGFFLNGQVTPTYWSIINSVAVIKSSNFPITPALSGSKVHHVPGRAGRDGKMM